MNNLKRFLSYLVKLEFSVAHIIFGMFACGALQHQHYIAAAIICVIGGIFCTYVEKLSEVAA